MCTRICVCVRVGILFRSRRGGGSICTREARAKFGSCGLRRGGMMRCLSHEFMRLCTLSGSLRMFRV